MSAPRPLRADRVVRSYGGLLLLFCHCEERSDAAIRFPARHRRADGTSYPKGICSAALHCRTPSPTGGLSRPSCRAGPMCPAARYACFPAGHAGPALQQGSAVIQGGQSRPPLRWDVGMPPAGWRVRKKESPGGAFFLFYFSLGIFQAVWSVWRRWWDFSPSGARKNSRYNACTSAFSWEKRTLVFLSMLQRISPR